jgi:hypothetical protein
MFTSDAPLISSRLFTHSMNPGSTSVIAGGDIAVFGDGGGASSFSPPQAPAVAVRSRSIVGSDRRGMDGMIRRILFVVAEINFPATVTFSLTTWMM